MNNPIQVSTEQAQQIFKNTRTMFPVDWNNTLKHLVDKKSETMFPQFKNKEELEKALLSERWVEVTSHLNPYYRVFRAQLSGNVGYIRIADLSEDAVLTARLAKGGNVFYLTVQRNEKICAKDTYMVAGIDNEKWTVFALHPGEPIHHYKLACKKLCEGQKLSIADALKRHFVWAKIVG